MKLTKSHREALRVLAECKDKGTILCINLADNGGISYLLEIKDDWRLVETGEKGSQWSEKLMEKGIMQYSQCDIVNLNGKRYIYQGVYWQDDREPNQFIIKPTIVKNLMQLNMIECLGTHFIYEAGVQPWCFGNKWETRKYETDYFFTAFQLK